VYPAGVEHRGEPGSPPFPTPAVDRVVRRVRKVFSSLDSLKYLGEAERRDFAYYRDLYEEQFKRITIKAREGRLRPLDLRGFPQDLRYPGYAARIGIFIGSFDPFQMTHLAMALRFLASDSSEADVLFVVPEGSPDPAKPRKTEYRFRYEILKRQLAGALEPLVVPLDLGEGADTIEIVRRLIALHPGSAMRLTHLIGSDSLPTAIRFLPADLEAWNGAAERYGVALDFSLFVVRRERSTPLRHLMRKVRSRGVPIVVDRNVIGTPSSTVFRSDRAITLVFPTESVFGSLELLFRYGMNQPWSSRPASPNAWWPDDDI